MKSIVCRNPQLCCTSHSDNPPWHLPRLLDIRTPILIRSAIQPSLVRYSGSISLVRHYPTFSSFRSYELTNDNVNLRHYQHYISAPLYFFFGNCELSGVNVCLRLQVAESMDGVPTRTSWCSWQSGHESGRFLSRTGQTQTSSPPLCFTSFSPFDSMILMIRFHAVPN